MKGWGISETLGALQAAGVEELGGDARLASSLWVWQVTPGSSMLAGWVVRGSG